MNNNKKSNKMPGPLIYIMIIAVLLMIIGGTYAWFTYNRTVETNKVSARTDNDDVKLLVSTKGGANFKGKDVAAIGQVNSADKMELMPVSTADLKNFLYSPITQGGKATYFDDVKNEKFYYHGRIFIKAEAKGDFATKKMNLYLDQSGSEVENFVKAEGEGILNASRIGLKFESSNPRIFRVSDKSNSKNNQVRNTVINGQQLGDGNVIARRDGKITAVADPSITLNKYTVKEVNGAKRLPDNPIIKMDMNKEYQLDIYFYIEGCDPDCSDIVQENEVDLQLAFFGVTS